jgi:4-amino-4-deoxy-L-arabinose transferase-like glycosyltransferase
MFRHLDRRAGHYLLLLAVTAALYLPNLGAPSLWDIDEGNNAECAREMLESSNYVVPTFNFQLRVDKPALLYWLQIGAFEAFGINEFAARLPSALAALLAVLATYELGRRMFGAGAGLLGGLVLASTAACTAAAHFANPDALLNACTVLTLLAFWHGFERGQPFWLVPMGACMGLAVLTKGPVGLVLPEAVVCLFLLWSGRLRFLWTRWTPVAAAAFVLVMGPWYAWVGADTKAEFLKGFFLTHNLGRAVNPMENHRGPFYYYALALLLGFLPWSLFLGPVLGPEGKAFGYAVWKRCWAVFWAVWRRVCSLLPTRYSILSAAPGPQLGARETRAEAAPDRYLPVRFLCCWAAVYFLCFSVVATKLPNYILPLYPPLALLTGRFLDRWSRGDLRARGWLEPVPLAGLALFGVGVTAGLLVVGGVLPAPRGLGGPLPGLLPWAAVGAVPVLGASLAWWCLRRQQRRSTAAVFTATAVVLVGLLAAGGSAALETRKAPRPLAQALQAAQTEPEVRVGCYHYFQPSLVFYCQREVLRFENWPEAVEFLRCPLPVYLVLPASEWEHDLRGRVQGPHRLLGRQYDFYRHCDVVVVTNR